MHTINQQITNMGMRVKFFQARLEIVLSSTQNIFEKFLLSTLLFAHTTDAVFPFYKTANAIKVTK